MKVTLDSIKSRLRMIVDIETASIACELEEDGRTIKLDKDIFIAFSPSRWLYFNEKEKEEVINRYKNIAKEWTEAIFGQDSKVKILVLDIPLTENFGQFKVINLDREPDIIITKEDLAERFKDIGGIKEAWIICEKGDSEKYINYEYDMGIYMKLECGVDEDSKYKEIKNKLFLLFGGNGNIFELGFLENNKKNIRYKWLELELDEMTKII